MGKHVFLLAVIVGLSISCDDGIQFSPSAPSPTYNGTKNGLATNDVNLDMWSPYLVVHATGEALQLYQKVIPELITRESLRGVRIEIVKDEHRNVPNSVNQWIASSVPDVLWILDNYYLFELNIEGVIDQVIKWYPSIRYLQIGNEITTILPRNGPQITIENYMNVLKRIYVYVEKRYPQIILVTQSTFGSGGQGSLELEKMKELGLEKMSPERLIIGVNVYSTSTARQNSYVLNRIWGTCPTDFNPNKKCKFRVWVTESGINDPSRHIGFVQQVYPYLRSVLRVERIYWYVLYEESGHKLAGLDGWTSPLFNALTATQRKGR